MSDSNYLTLRVTLATGETLTFEQNDRQHIDVVIAMLNNPSKMFAQSHIIFGERDRLNVIRTDRISRIDFVNDDLKQFHYLSTAQNVREISKYVFEQRYEQSFYAAERKAAAEEEGVRQEGFVQLDIAGAGTVYWEVVQTSQHLKPMDVEHMVLNLLNSDGLIAELSDSNGAMVVNPVNVASVAFLPGPPIRPARTWVVDRIASNSAY